MKKRIIVHMRNGQPVPLNQLEGVETKKNVLKVWSVLNREKEADLLKADLKYGRGLSAEDFVHDWVIRGNEFHIYSKTVNRGDDITLLLEVV